MKTFKIIISVLLASTFTACKSIPMVGEEPTEINWWLSAAFMLIWLVFSCPHILVIFVNLNGGFSDKEDLDIAYKICGASNYAFPIMLFLNRYVGEICEWYISFIICLVVGCVAGFILRAKHDRISDENVDKMKWFWIFEGLMFVFCVIMALV